MSTYARRRLDEILESISTANVQTDVAMRLLKMADAPVGVAEYSRVISLDAALSARIIKAANSAYFAPVRPRTTVLDSVRMIGTVHARTLSLVFAFAGLHRRKTLDPDDLKAYWHAALCKATAWAALLRSAHARESDSTGPDTGFLFGLVQDIGLPVLAEAGGEDYRKLLLSPDLEIMVQLDVERKMFGLDHARVGRLVGERMGLPPWLLTVIELHHAQDWIRPAGSRQPPAPVFPDAGTPPASPAADIAAAAAERGPQAVIGAAVSLMPHDVRTCSSRDASLIDQLLAAGVAGPWTGVAHFMQQLRSELTGTMGQILGFDNRINLSALYASATQRLAEQTEELVGQVGFLTAHYQQANPVAAE